MQGPDNKVRSSAPGKSQSVVDHGGSSTGASAAVKLSSRKGGDGRRSPSQRAHRSHRSDNGGASSVYGALDLGTNNCRLLVARPSRRGFVVVDAFSRIIRLGEGLAHTGALAPAAMDRTIEALKVCADKMERRGVRRSRLIATEACRSASNGAAFIDRARDETGLALEIVSRETEARLAVSGCASLIDTSCDYALVFDIGGGSSELIWLDVAGLADVPKRSLADRLQVQDRIIGWTSLEIGVVTLAERFGMAHVDRPMFEDMVAYVRELLAPFEETYRFADRIAGQSAHLLGTSGTVTTVAGMHLGLPRYDRRRVDGCWMQTRDVQNVGDRLVDMTYEQRVAQPCIGTDRADLVLAGCAILEALLRTWSTERLRVADRGLREGILATLMAEDGAPRRDGGGH